jgi:hypothetical protein
MVQLNTITKSMVKIEPLFLGNNQKFMVIASIMEINPPLIEWKNFEVMIKNVQVATKEFWSLDLAIEH